jgi:lipopolysaccharide export system protein LptC
MSAEKETAPEAVRSERERTSFRALDWTIATRANLLSARRYSLFVKFMKGALPLAALGLGAAVVAYVLQPRENARMAVTFERLSKVENDLAMVKPRLTGVDDQGLPFVVSALSASQVSRGSDSVELNDVTADITLKNGTSLHVTAGKGIVDTKSHTMNLSGGIHLTTTDGYDARTAAANADLKAGNVHGEQPIEADGKFGHITAMRFAMNRDKGQLLFTGQVRMLLHGVPTKP